MHQPLMISLEIVLQLIAIGLLICSFVLSIECSFACLPTPFWLCRSAQNRLQTSSHQRPRVVILVPAHNEAAVIQATLETLVPQITGDDQLIVIADNCTDDTAAIARASGVRVIERHNLTHRGKGYALDYGLRFLQAEPPDIVVTVDADCLVAPDTIAQISQLAFLSARPVQATYLMVQPQNPSIRDRISALAVVIKNLVRPLGLSRLGCPCLLVGSGMAFPWSALRQVSLANSKTVDDMQLSIDLAIAGYPPLYCPAAQVTGRLMSSQAALSQRSRWEHGHLEVILTEVPRLLAAALRQQRGELAALALELCVPPLSLLTIGWLVAVLVTAILQGVGLSSLPLRILLVQGVVLLGSLFAVWWKFGQTLLPLRHLLSVGLYIAWKLPLYGAFFVRPQTRWVRTERDEVESPHV